MDWIKDIVNGLIEVYGTRDVYVLLDSYNARVEHKDFLNPDEKARLIRDEFGYYTVYISYLLNEKEKMFILYHELGHIVLHNLSCEYYLTSRVNKDKVELQADYFASLMYIDESSIDIIELEGLSEDELSSYFAIPKELIKYRLSELSAEWKMEECAEEVMEVTSCK